MEKIMTNRIRITIALALVCAAMSTAVYASDSAYLYLVQGIPGRDYSSATDPEFPVDVLINDAVCYVRGLDYGTISGPLTLAPGSYDVKVSVANSLAPCSNPAIADNSVMLEPGKTVSAVLALNSSAAPTLTTFNENLTSVPVNDGRILFALAADSGAVQVILENLSTKKLYTYSVSPGQVLSQALPAGTYAVEINEGANTLVPATNIVLSSQSAALLFATGKASNNTLNLETKIVKDVI
jgi:Domain of unknown function (DUF4397)